MSGRVFISHSSKDKGIARRIAGDLHDAGINVWMDDSEVRPGSSIASAIAEGIDNSDYFLILVSGHSVQSRWVHAEVEMAFSRSMEVDFPIIPIKLDKSPVPKPIKHLHFVDFTGFGGSEAAYKAGLGKLLSFFRTEQRLASDTRKHAAASSDSQSDQRGGDCVTFLKSLSTAEIRKKIASDFSYEEISVFWFDLFGTRLNDEINNMPKPNAVIELLDRAKRKKKIEQLFGIICAQD